MLSPTGATKHGHEVDFLVGEQLAVEVKAKKPLATEI